MTERHTPPGRDKDDLKKTILDYVIKEYVEDDSETVTYDRPLSLGGSWTRSRWSA